MFKKIMFKKIIEYCLDKIILPNSLSFQRYIKDRPLILGKYDLTITTSNCTINQVLGEYEFYDIQKDDIVLDIGANVGGFSMFISNSVKHIFAVEPLFTDILTQNITQNHIKNITVLNIGLGLNPFFCEFESRGKMVNCKSLLEIIQMCGGKVDFLKCDCEGGEWNIKPHELVNIRRIEAEVHSFNGENMILFVKMLRNLNYKVTITNKEKTTMLIHAHKINT